MARPKKAITKAQIKAEVTKKKQFKAKRKTEHFLAANADYVEHPLDIDLIEANRSGKYAPGQEFFFGLMDDNLDANKGTYYFSWNKEELVMLWEGVLYRSLGIIRYLNDIELLNIELNWICSSHFDEVCAFLGYDAAAIRIEIPKLLEAYSQFSLLGNDYLFALKKYRDFVLNDATPVYSAAYDVEEI